jgi:hypothetical protein
LDWFTASRLEAWALSVFQLDERLESAIFKVYFASMHGAIGGVVAIVIIAATCM